MTSESSLDGPSELNLDSTSKWQDLLQVRAEDTEGPQKINILFDFSPFLPSSFPFLPISIHSGIIKPQSPKPPQPTTLLSIKHSQLILFLFVFFPRAIFSLFQKSIRAHFHPRWINHPSASPWRRPASSSSSSPPSCSSPCQAFSCGCSGTPTASVAAGAKKPVARWDKL